MKHTPICFFQYSEEILIFSKQYCIISGAAMQENKSSRAVIFVPFFT